jgi:hypothetical protein
MTPIQPTSGYYNTSSTSSAASIAPNFCCALRPQGVAIGEWWNTTYSVTTATVITKFTQYNDTVVSQTTTLIDSSPATDSLSIPDLVFGIYGTSIPVYGSTLSIPGGPIM